MSGDPPPNVLIVMSDQHHPRFMGCAGHPFLHTPNMNRLAQAGVRFEHAHCNFPLCAPSRMAFMTGQYPSQLNFLSNQPDRVLDQPTFAHAFSQAGYDTVLSGRMHFRSSAQRYGFHAWLVGDLIGHSPTAEDSAPLQGILGPELARTTGPHARSIRISGSGTCGYLTYDEALTDRTVQWLRTRGERAEAPPFMMTVGLIEPHAPFVARPEDFDRYNGRISVDDLPAQPPESLHPEMRRLRRHAKLEGDEPVSLEDQRRTRVAYHGMCTFVDRMLGRILDALEDSGLAENTIVVYTSDHGEQIGEHGMWWKHTFYDGSIGIPMLIAGPGIEPGCVVTQNVSLMDLPPTLLDLCNAPAVPGAVARSFRCLIDGDAREWPDEVFAENLWPADASCVHRMVRRGPWKLNLYHSFAPELYNLDDDPQEMRNRAHDSSCRQVRSELEARAIDGWDHDAVLAAHRQRLAASPMMRHALTRSEQSASNGPPEPWFDPEHPPENHFDSAAVGSPRDA